MYRVSSPGRTDRTAPIPARNAEELRGLLPNADELESIVSAGRRRESLWRQLAPERVASYREHYVALTEDGVVAAERDADRLNERLRQLDISVGDVLVRFVNVPGRKFSL